MSLGVSGDVAVGQKVYAIGNPFGLDHTLTTGIVSGIHREIQSGITGRPIQDAIQVRTRSHVATRRRMSAVSEQRHPHSSVWVLGVKTLAMPHPPEMRAPQLTA